MIKLQAILFSLESLKLVNNFSARLTISITPSCTPTHFDFKNIEEQYPNFNYHVALSDPQDGDDWDGCTGFIHQVLHDNYLESHDDPTEIEYYMCGPPMMVEAAENMLYNLGVEPEMVAFDKF